MRYSMPSKNLTPTTTYPRIHLHLSLFRCNMKSMFLSDRKVCTNRTQINWNLWILLAIYDALWFIGELCHRIGAVTTNDRPTDRPNERKRKFVKLAHGMAVVHLSFLIDRQTIAFENYFDGNRWNWFFRLLFRLILINCSSAPLHRGAQTICIVIHWTNEKRWKCEMKWKTIVICQLMAMAATTSKTFVQPFDIKLQTQKQLRSISCTKKWTKA